jgi:hypothetical protein
MILVFILLNALFLTGRNWLVKKGFDPDVLIIGNMLLFIVLLISFIITQRSLKSENPNAFVRAMYGSFIIKFFVLALAAFIYIIITKQNVNKPALIACMGLYIVYTVFEVSSLMRLLKQKKNV